MIKEMILLMYLRIKIFFSGDVEEDVHYMTQGLEPTFEESIPKIIKLKRQKISDDKQTSISDMPYLESKESTEQKRKQRG